MQPDHLPAADGKHEEDDLARRVTDYLAGMTDRYCIREYTELAGAQSVRPVA